MRFKNEFDFIENLGGTNINVISPKRNKQALDRESGGDAEKRAILAGHSSETELDSGRIFAYTIFNDFGDEIKAVIECRDIVRNIVSKTKKTGLYLLTSIIPFVSVMSITPSKQIA